VCATRDFDGFLRQVAFFGINMPGHPRHFPAVLTFAATDPSGGAGLQADLLTLASMGCHPLSVVTAITVQDTSGVEGIQSIDADWVSDQARAILEDIPIAAFKIGVMGSVENIAAIAEIVSDYPEIPLVFDPVLASTRGDEFASEDALEAMRQMIVPQTTVLTPNTLELLRLALGEDEDRVPADKLARRLTDMGAEYVLVTGTHDSTLDVINTLYGDSGVMRSDRWQRLAGSYHGSGCTLASAIAATIARGLDIEEAVREAQDYTWHSLKFGFRPGMGQFIPDRMFWARDEDETESADQPDTNSGTGDDVSRTAPTRRDDLDPRH
jgi:hydroxymethylpyrimidine/phosphomethylpyrimidine kinase